MRLCYAAWKGSQNIFSSFFLVVLKLESATHGTIGVFITGEKDEQMSLQTSYVGAEYTCISPTNSVSMVDEDTV